MRRVLCGLVMASAIFAGCSALDTRPRKPSGRIVVLGDSLSVSPSDAQNFPAMLEDRLRAEGLSWSVVNAGVRGDTTAGGLRRIDTLLAVNRPDILVLALGANDGLRKLDVEQMSSNLREMISRAKIAGADVLLCGMELPPLNFLTYGREFRDAFPRLAEDEEVTLVPFLLEGVALDGKMNGADGMHPNAAGARQIADTIWPYLDDLIRQ